MYLSVLFEFYTSNVMLLMHTFPLSLKTSGGAMRAVSLWSLFLCFSVFYKKEKQKKSEVQNVGICTFSEELMWHIQYFSLNRHTTLNTIFAHKKTEATEIREIAFYNANSSVHNLKAYYFFHHHIIHPNILLPVASYRYILVSPNRLGIPETHSMYVFQ